MVFNYLGDFYFAEGDDLCINLIDYMMIGSVVDGCCYFRKLCDFIFTFL